MFRWVLIPLLAPALAGCQMQHACPAIGYSSTLTVRLADDWPDGDDRTVTLDCADPGPCALGVVPSPPVLQEPSPEPVPSPAAPPSVPEEPAPVPVSLVDGTAEIVMFAGPDDVVLTVWEGGRVATSLEVEPDWVRVGGSEECGGPAEATVVVPAP